MDIPLPRYVRVYRALRERILSSELKPGDQLPPQHDLAAQYNVAFATLQRALGLLEADRLVVRRHGLGTFIADPEESIPHVLVVEAEAPVREMLAAVIQESGFIADLAETGDSGLAILQQRQFTHLFTEVQLPDISGVELAARALESNPDTAIVMLSADPQDLAGLSERDIWPVIVVPKPFRSSQIRQALRMGVSVREAPEADARASRRSVVGEVRSG